MDNQKNIRINSQVKHFILKDYLYAWSVILGTKFKTINYYDCFAGCGKYLCENKNVDGSPVVALKVINDLCNDENVKYKPSKFVMKFVELDKQNKEKLKQNIDFDYNKQCIDVDVIEQQAQPFVDGVIKNGVTSPSFFFIDPYGYPIALDLMKTLMSIQHTELFVNFMHFEMIRNIPNEQEEDNMKLILGNEIISADLKTGGKYDAEKIISYITNKIGSKYYIPFRINFGEDEMVSSNRLKYLLIFFTNNFLGFEVMLEVMWKHSKDGTPLEVSDNQSLLFATRQEDDLKVHIEKKYCPQKQTITFLDLRKAEWALLYKKKHFKNTILKLEKEDRIKINRIESKRTVEDKDEITFGSN